MNKIKIASLIFAAVMSCQVLVSCGSKTEDSVSDSSISSSESEKNSKSEKVSNRGMNPVFEQENDETYDSDACAARVLEAVGDAEKSDEAFKFGSIGDFVSPDAEDKDGDLGDYRESENGVKLYFEDEKFPKELMQTLEQYFLSFESVDYSLYTRCVYPEYFEQMDKFLQANYNYDMKTSFSNQCANLANIMNGTFRISRIKVEPAEQYAEGTDNLDTYFGNLESLFEMEEGKFYDTVKNDVDKIYDATFFVMAEKPDGNEELLVSGFEIVFVEKDGRYYIFG